MPRRHAPLRRRLETLVFPALLAQDDQLVKDLPVSPDRSPTSPGRACLAWFVPPVVFLALAWLAHRDGFRLSFDAHYYVEFAKQFRHEAPDSFGNAWPFGWPVLGAVTGLAGLGAYHGLLVLAVGGWCGLLVAAAGQWPWNETGNAAGILALSAVGSLFPILIYTVGAFSEPLFSLVVFAFGVSLARWPRRSAVVSAALLALLAFTLRYSGGLLFLMLGGWLVLRRRDLRAARSAGLAWTSTAVAGIVALSLVSWNRLAMGHWSGHERGPPVAPVEWPVIASDLGWSLPALVGGLGLRDALGFSTALRVPLGIIIVVGLLWAGGRTWRVAASDLARTSGALVFVYAAGLIGLRCVGSFDALHNARMALPLLLPLVFLLPVRQIARPVGRTACAGLLLLNIFLAWRGASPGIGADVRPAVALIDRLAGNEFVSVNDAALTLSAWLDTPVRRLADTPGRPGRFVVLAATTTARDGGGTLGIESRNLAAGLGALGYITRLETAHMIVLECPIQP